MTPRLAPHQVEAVEQILSTLERRGGVLLADEVGLGKSWIAAAVAKHFSGRGVEIEIIVPRALLSQWRLLVDAFSVDAALLTHDSLHGKFAFPGEGNWRLMVVDEAHRFRNPSTHRYRALATRSIGNRLLLVTATPICNRPEDLFALLRLIAPDDLLMDAGVGSIEMVFGQRDHEPLDLIRGELVLRRTRAVLPGELQFGLLRREVVRFPLVDEEQKIRTMLETLQFPLITTPPHHRTVRQFLWRRLESSVAAWCDSLRRQKRFYHRARESLAQGLTLTKSDYRRIFGTDEDELMFQDLLFRDFWHGYATAGAEVGSQIDRELATLESLENAARRSVDRKAELLIRLIEDSTEPVIVFTAALATARELFRRCNEHFPTGLVSSRDCRTSRFRHLSSDKVFDSFRRGEMRVVILTDLGAEGLNLQQAGIVVHYDLPWNPVRLEQRNGRIHRVGQRRPLVRAIYFLPQNRSEWQVMRRLCAKNRVRRSILGARIGSRHPDPSLPFGKIRTVLRPRLTVGEPQVKLVRRLLRMRLLTDSLADLLVARFRSGAEMVIGEMSREYLDRQRLGYLERVLSKERQLTGYRADSADR